MDVLRTALREIFGLFVDDGSFALAILAWSVAAWLVLPHLPSAADAGGVVYFIGLATILVWSAWRRSRR